MNFLKQLVFSSEAIAIFTSFEVFYFSSYLNKLTDSDNFNKNQIIKN